MNKLGAWSLSLPDGGHRWTEEALKIHGLPAGRSTSLDELIRVYIPEHRNLIRSAFEACGGEGTPFDLTLALKNHESKRVWVRFTGEAVRDASGRILQARGGIQDVTGQVESTEGNGVLSHSIDITEEKALAKTLLRSQRLENIGALAGGVAHDLNNILSPIIIATDLLERNLPDKRQRELLSTIRNSALRGSEMVKQILTFARGADGQTSIIDFNLILKEIRRLVAETFPKEIHYTFFDCPHPWSVEGDATQLHQVLLNLCVNARDAMPMGGRLNVGIENFRLTEGDAAPVRGMAPGTYVRMFVADDGEGIAPGDLDRIFDPFFSTKPPGAGTGLGLATSRDIIKKHGGSITVQSEPGNGAIFQVFVPAKPR
ncbi:MAG: hypothetical protein JJU00_07350 [Opitutales bacterium]|nr:hypothetical protein [Opitutales bacterium]